MDKFKEEIPQRVQFSVRNGSVEFQAENLKEWELTDTLQRVEIHLEASQRLAEMRESNLFMMHGIALIFVLLLAFSVGFVVSREVSSNLKPQIEVQPSTTPRY